MTKAKSKSIDSRKCRRVMKNSPEFFRIATGRRVARHNWGDGISKHALRESQDNL